MNDPLQILNESGSAEEQHAEASPTVNTPTPYVDSPERLHNDNVLVDDSQCPQRQREMPHHRLWITLRADGYSNKEIAQITGYTPTAVGHVLRMPWARQRLLELIGKTAQDPVSELLRLEALNNVETLVEVRNDESAPAAARLAAANSMLDRYLGKPVQRTEMHQRDVPIQTLEEAQRELELLKAEESRLRGN